MVPKLLVSVRDVEEAVAALRGGCDVLDVKEPARGPLGMADPETITAIVDVTAEWNHAHGTHIPVSVALGEALDWEHLDPPVLPRVAFVKMGTAGLRTGKWTTRWRTALGWATSRVIGRPQAILATYADWERAGSPDPDEAILLARDLDADGVLLDTYTKSDTSLVNELTVDRLTQLRDRARRRSRLFAIAGSLRLEQLKELAPVEPDLIGVRGAVCLDGRDSSVRAERVAEFRSRLVTAFEERSNSS